MSVAQVSRANGPAGSVWVLSAALAGCCFLAACDFSETCIGNLCDEGELSVTKIKPVARPQKLASVPPGLAIAAIAEDLVCGLGEIPNTGARGLISAAGGDVPREPFCMRSRPVYFLVETDGGSGWVKVRAKGRGIHVAPFRRVYHVERGEREIVGLTFSGLIGCRRVKARRFPITLAVRDDTGRWTRTKSYVRWRGSCFNGSFRFANGDQ